MNATIRYIRNGFLVGGQAPSGVVSYFAATIPEVVYWLAQIFEPSTAAGAAATTAPRTIIDNDPLLGQQAYVEDLSSGGYLVRQMQHTSGAQQVEQWCASLDDVHGVLNLIFAPPT